MVEPIRITEAMAKEMARLAAPVMITSRKSTESSEPAPEAHQVKCTDCGDFGGRWSDIDELGLVRYKEWCQCELGQAKEQAYFRDVETKTHLLQQQRINGLFGAAMIPEMFRRAKLEDFGSQVIMTHDVIPAINDCKSLLLAGKAGTGKTHLAAAILNGQLKDGKPGLFVEVPDLLAKIRRTFSNQGDGESLIEAVCVADVAVLDDLGAEKPSEWVSEQLFRIINSRYSHCRFTVFTSNLDPKELAKRLSPEGKDYIGDRIVSRLVGMCHVVTMNGKDRRTA